MLRDFAPSPAAVVLLGTLVLLAVALGAATAGYRLGRAEERLRWVEGRESALMPPRVRIPGEPPRVRKRRRTA